MAVTRNEPPAVEKIAALPDAKYYGALSDKRAPAADVTVAEVDAEREMIVNGKVYDVSTFIKKHPGGSVIKFQLGTDATDAFNAFHSRSKKAALMLASLPNRPLPAHVAEDALTRDFEALRQQLKAEGYFDPSPMHVAYRVGEILVMHAIGFGLIFQGWWVIGGIIAGLAQGRCGWLQHEGGHYSLTGHIPTDRHLQMLFYGLGCGMSGCYWRNQHNKHHAAPQKLHADPDLQTLPLVAFHKIIGEKGSKLWLAWQAPLFFCGVITWLVATGWQFLLHPKHALRVNNYVELGYMGVRYALWHYAFGHLGLAREVGLYCYYLAVAAGYIFINFAVSHTHKDVVPSDRNISWALYSANHTTNCTPGPLCNWWMAYLNFQIEHHLFPSMPQFNHPKICHRVKALFEKHGVEYDVRSYWDCMKVTYKNLLEVGTPNHH